MKKVEFDLYIHIVGEYETDEEISSPNDLTDAIFDEEADFEIYDITDDVRFASNGYFKVEEIEDED